MSHFPAPAGAESTAPNLIKIERHVLPRLEFGRAEIARRRVQDVLPRAPLHRVRHAAEGAPQADFGVATAGLVTAAGAMRAVPPEREGVAIAPLLQNFLGLEPRRELRRRQFRFAFRRRSGFAAAAGTMADIIADTLHGRALPFSRRVVAPELHGRRIANGE